MKVWCMKLLKHAVVPLWWRWFWLWWWWWRWWCWVWWWCWGWNTTYFWLSWINKIQTWIVWIAHFCFFFWWYLLGFTWTIRSKFHYRTSSNNRSNNCKYHSNRDFLENIHFLCIIVQRYIQYWLSFLFTVAVLTSSIPRLLLIDLSTRLDSKFSLVTCFCLCWL